jgi:RNA polymerase sigma factor (sigma-70 family)
MNSMEETARNPRDKGRSMRLDQLKGPVLLQEVGTTLKAELQPIISDAYMQGQERFGNLGLALPAYTARICAILRKNLGLSPPVDRAVSFVKALHGRDLYLATACIQCGPGASPDNNSKATVPESASLAWKTLETTYKGLICDLVRFFYRTSFAAQDLADNIVADLFFPDRSGHSRIASYDGRSSLGTWLRVVICNRAINAQRCTASAKSTELKPELPDAPALAIIESTVRARRYAAAVEDSLSLACRTLTPKERLMLLWRYQDGLQLGQIARLLGIHQSNVTRQLERVQGKLRDHVTTVLLTRHALSRLAVEECLEDIVENPLGAVSILELVKALQDPHHEESAAVAQMPRSSVRNGTTSLEPSFPGNGLVKEA